MSTSALSIAVSALRSHSYAIETTTHNIANSSTPGYRRQRVDLAAGAPRAGGVGLMGSGVVATGISRATDRFSDLRTRGALGQAAYYGVRSDTAIMTETAFGEPDFGLSGSLGRLWEGFSTLSLRPSDAAARNQVIAGLSDVASRVNGIRDDLAQLSADTSARLSDQVGEMNGLMRRLAELNSLPRDGNGLPPDLADERDNALDRLAAGMGARSEVDGAGRVRVFVDGVTLLDSDHYSPLEVPGAPLGEVQHSSAPIRLGGSIGGAQAALTIDIAGARSRLDTFVGGLVTALNTTHATGFTPGGAAGGALLTDTSGRLQVSVASPSDLAASDTPGGVQNGRVADALAQLRGAQGEAYRGVLSAIASDVAALNRSADTAASVADSATIDRDSVVGVNLDEEMANLVSQQRAYEAAARIVSIVDEMLQTLIQMT